MTEPLIQPTNFRSQMRWLKRLAPLSLLGLVVFYELVPSRWVDVNIGETYHYWAEIIFYGILGPALAYLAFILLERWLEERETSDLQAAIVKQHQADLAESRKLTDDALQALFAASVMISTLEPGDPSRTAPENSQVQATKQAIDCTIQRLRTHLTEAPAFKPPR